MTFPNLKISRSFVSDGIWSLAGSVLSVVAGLAAVKVTTMFVPANEYGNASLVLGFLALLNTLLVGPVMVAHLRIYFDYSERGLAQRFVRNFSWILMAIAAAMILLYFLVAAAFYFAGQYTYLALLLPSSMLIIAQPYFSSVTNYLEAHGEYRKLAIINVLQKVAYLAILFALLVASFSGSISIILAQALALTALLILTRVFTMKHDAKTEQAANEESAGLGQIKESFMGFGWALPLGYFVQWTLTTSDRYLIDHFLSVKSVGMYTMNYGFWSMPYLMLNGWLEILTRPLLYRSAVTKAWDRVKITLVWRVVVGLGLSILGTLVFYFFGQRIASLMMGQNYWVGMKLVMALTLGHCFYVLGYSLVPAFLASKQTKPILTATCLAAATNILANLVLIPAYGIEGAAFSTLLSYLVWAGFLVLAVIVSLKSLKSEYALPDTIAGAADFPA